MSENELIFSKKDPGDTLKLFTLYLEKMDGLSKGERSAYEKYLICVVNPIMVIPKLKINVKNENCPPIDEILERMGIAGSDDTKKSKVETDDLPSSGGGN